MPVSARPATDLSVLDDASVDVVTTRSVLIYVSDKRRAFFEFHRVLRPGGRISIFEPVASFRVPEPPGLFLGCDVTPVRHLADEIKAVYERAQPRDSHPCSNLNLPLIMAARSIRTSKKPLPDQRSTDQTTFENIT